MLFRSKVSSISNSSFNGNIVSTNTKNDYLKVSTSTGFIPESIIRGETSNSYATIKSIESFQSIYNVDSSSIVQKGWNKETGFLNNEQQRLHDSDYYQYFSYALKSQKDFGTWGDSVNSLNHTAGFKKFSDLIIESTPTNSGISTDQNQGDFTGTADLSRIIDLNCVYDFDLAKENNLNIDGFTKSNEITLNSKIVQD